MSFRAFLILVLVFIFLLLNKGNNLSFLDNFEFNKGKTESDENELVEIEVIPVQEDLAEVPNIEEEDFDIIPQSNNNGKFNFYSVKKGKIIIKNTDFVDADFFSEGLAMVGIRDYKKKDKRIYSYGYIDEKGKTKIDFDFSDGGRFGSGLAPVQFTKKGKYGYIDPSGNLVLDTIYNNMAEFRNNRALISNKSSYQYMSPSSSYAKMGFIDPSGKIVIPQIYEYVYPFSEGLSAVKKDGKWGYIDTSGRTVIPFIYSYAAPFVKGMAPVTKNGKLGFISKERKPIVPFLYEDYMFLFETNSFYMKLYKKYKSYITKSGFMILKKDGKWGYIDFPEQEEVIPFEYDQIDIVNTKTGEIFAAKNEKWGVIDIDNNVLVPFKYEEVDQINDGMRPFKKDGKWGYLNSDGEEVIPPRFTYKSKFYNGKAYVQENGSYIYVNKKGKTVK